VDENNITILGILGNDKNIIPYRKELNKITGGITATILLQQFIYWWNITEQKAFYKFIEPCDHRDYKEGDSWTEELGMTKYEFRTAFKKLNDLDIVSKRTNAQRVTYYSVNTDILAKLIKSIYLSGQCQSSKLIKSIQLSGHYQHTSIAETTSETTQRETLSENSSFPFFVKEFGEDEESNTIGKPSMNQVRAEAKRIDIDLEVAESFWLKQEGLHWDRISDWRPMLRRFGMTWERNENKSNRDDADKKEKRISVPTTTEEMRLFFKQMDEGRRDAIKFQILDTHDTSVAHPVVINQFGFPVYAETLGGINSGDYVSDSIRTRILNHFLAVYGKRSD